MTITKKTKTHSQKKKHLPSEALLMFCNCLNSVC